MSSRDQISAFVSEETRELLERHTRATGVKKGFVVEQALRQYLRALRELPADVIVPARIVVSRAAADRIADAVEHPRKPPDALVRLMRRR